VEQKQYLTLFTWCRQIFILNEWHSFGDDFCFLKFFVGFWI